MQTKHFRRLLLFVSFSSLSLLSYSQKVKPEKPGGTIPVGKWNCREYGTWKFTYNQFTIDNGSSYTFFGSQKKPGKFTYNSKTGRMDFTSGPYAPSKDGTITGQFGTLSGRQVIVLNFKIPGWEETCEVCYLQAK